MVESIKKINNPLTIIAIFAALAEINATIAISLIDKSLHYIFIWFIIGFPSILVLLFFATLNLNTKVMYSPSDYRDDKTFLDSLYGPTIQNKAITRQEDITIIMESFEQKLINVIDEKMKIKGTKTLSSIELEQLVESYKQEIKELSNQTIKQNSIIDFEIPIELKNEIARWLVFPAYLPIICAIVKENISSISQLKSVENKYNLPSNWDVSGLPGILKRGTIINGSVENFSIVPEIKDALTKWININEMTIHSISKVYSKNESKEAIMAEARVLSLDLKF